MRKVIAIIFLLGIFPFLQSCITDSKSGDSPIDTAKDEKGEARKPATPRVSYQTFDSLILITITGSKTGEEDNYWIYRDGILLEQPSFSGKTYLNNPNQFNSIPTFDSTYYISSSITYSLWDSVRVPGNYKYTVQYGPRKDFLSEKSAEYIFKYQGSSPSGKLFLLVDEQQLVTVSLQPGNQIPFHEIRIERKIGAGGNIEILDTIEFGHYNYQPYWDTAFIPLDAVVYYRASVKNEDTDTWLNPTPWDSITVNNKYWDYTPEVTWQNPGTEIKASINNLVFEPGSGGYYLYRNSSASKVGKVKVDSLPYEYSSPNEFLQDKPKAIGTYYYWVEAVDRHGRTSMRSVPKAIKFTGKEKGPEILNIQSSSASISISFSPNPYNSSYILQRTLDTNATSIESVDTITGGGFSFYSQFIDYPPSSGNWFYRVLSYSYTENSEPGDWVRSGFFRFQTNFNDLSASITNQGDHIEAITETYVDAKYVLYRSKYPNGADSIAVDSLDYSGENINLTDKPPLGIWYYRIFRFSKTRSYDNTIYRSSLYRMEFTGKLLGPTLQPLNLLANGILITINPIPDALAYVLERSEEGAKDWAIIDTTGADPGVAKILKDRPPAEGFWNYRARAILSNLKLTEPGPFISTQSKWSNQVTYSNSLNAEVMNMGDRVESNSYRQYSYQYYFYRSSTADYKNGTLVDSLRNSSYESILKDIPPLGTYYYWVERVSGDQYYGNTILRSRPKKIEFTGAPEISSLSHSSGSITIGFPGIAADDSLEIWKSTEKPDNAASFTLLKTITSSDYSSSYFDHSVSSTESGFYHYKLAIQKNGSRIFGSVKSIYYEP